MDHSDPLNGHNLPQILQTGKNSSCCVHLAWFGLLEPQTVLRVFWGGLYFADVWLVSIHQTNTVILCLRLARISWTSTKSSKIPNKTI